MSHLEQVKVVTIFSSRTTRDNNLLKKLRDHLIPLQQSDPFKILSDNDIVAGSNETLLTDTSDLADTLAIPKKKREDKNLRLKAIRDWLQKHDGWLLIIDDLDDFTLLDQLVSDKWNGHILLTTHPQATRTITHSYIIEQMAPDDGALFLLRRTGMIAETSTRDEADANDYKQAKRLVNTLGGFPLALDQAGAYIEETGRDLAGYLALYRQHRSILLNRRGGNNPPYHKEPVTTTLLLALEKVALKQPETVVLLSLCAFLQPDAIPTEMLTQGASDLPEPLRSVVTDGIQFDEAIGALFKFSLVHRQSNPNTLSIHRIVQAVLQDKCTEDQQRQWKSHVVQLVSNAFPEVDFSSWQICSDYFSQAQLCADYIEELDLKSAAAAQLLYRLGRYCYDRALYAEAEKFLKRALSIYEQNLGSQHLDIIPGLDALALVYSEQGRYQLAEPLYLRALAIGELLYGPDHPDTATMINNLALHYQELGKYALAEPLYQRALSIRQNTLPMDDPDIAQSLNNLATLYQCQGDYQNAVLLLQHALDICEQTLGQEHPDTAQSLNNLAALYGMQKKYALAEPLYQRALSIYEQTLGPEHPDTALTLNNIALLYDEQEQYQL